MRLDLGAWHYCSHIPTELEQLGALSLHGHGGGLKPASVFKYLLPVPTIAEVVMNNENFFFYLRIHEGAK